jgi:DNA-binding SARP family transcriptional activator/tetratricopeptide (TPR) repeat protein
VGIEFKILGPPEILVAGESGVAISPQLWCVLVSLLLTPNVPQPTEVLVDHLWGENPPSKAGTTVKSYVWRIERALSQAAGDAVYVSRRAHGYALDVDMHAVDLHRFRSLKRQSDAIAESGESRHAVMLLREAEALWRGGALAGLPGDWIGRVRGSLEEELRAATTRRIELELALGRHAELLAELSELAERYPLDEVLAGHRMIALFRAGRQADALRVYRETRALLVTEGVEPASGLARLHQRILQQDSELALTPVHQPEGSRERQRNTLPADIRDFVGRTEEMWLLTQKTESETSPMLWVIEGMGGVGKTSLAVHAGHAMAERYPDAQIYLPFRAHDQLRKALDPADALRDLLIMLGVPSKRVPDTLGARTELWRTELAARQALVIFDDVTGPDQVMSLLPEAGDCLIIVTSRRRHPRWSGARSLTLRVLPEDDAVALFTQIAGHAAERDPDHVARLARLCGCLPLAIRLAASRLRSGSASSLPDLIDELDERSVRHSQAGEVGYGVKAAFELSYRQLVPSEQRLFRYLGICPCLNISPYSAAVLSESTVVEAEAALECLSSHHLLERKSREQYGFHDLIRAFAAARFANEDTQLELRNAFGRLADYYMCTVRHANEVLRAHQRQASSEASAESQLMPFIDKPNAVEAWLESEWGNALRIAQYCAGHEWKRRSADLIHELGEFLETSGHWDEALKGHVMALRACRDLDDLPGVARAAFELSLTSLRTGHIEEALQYATEAATAFGTLRDRRGQAAALDRVGVIHRNAARFREALAHHQEALGIYREVHDPQGLARTLGHAGTALGSLGRLPEQMNCLSEALSIYNQSGDLRGQAITLNNIGAVQHDQGYHRDAMRSYCASREIFRKIGGRQSLALLEHNIGRLHEYKGDHETAIAVYREVHATYRSIGDLQHQAYALNDIGSVYQRIDRLDEALAHHERAASVAEAAGDRYTYVTALCGVAEAHFGSDRLSAALGSYQQAARIAGEIESLYLKATALNGTAEILLRTQGPEAARICLREAHDIFAQLGVPEAATVEIRLQALDTSAY